MILSIIAVVISALAVIVTLLIYRLASAPDIVVYLDGRSGSDVVIVVENTGRKAAHDITFSIERNPIDDVVAPITCLVPNEKRTFLWGSYRELQTEFQGKVVPVKVEYYRSTGTLRKSSSNLFKLDIVILKRTIPEQDSLRQISNSVEGINRTLRGVDRILDDIRDRILDDIRIDIRNARPFSD